MAKGSPNQGPGWGGLGTRSPQARSISIKILKAAKPLRVALWVTSRASKQPSSRRLVHTTRYGPRTLR